MRCIAVKNVIYMYRRIRATFSSVVVVKSQDDRAIVCILDRGDKPENRVTRSLFVPWAWEVESSRPEHGPLCSLSQPGNDDRVHRTEKRSMHCYQEGS